MGPTTGCSRSRGTGGRRPTSHPSRSIRRPRSGICRRQWLAGRVVLVGTTLDGVDRHRTPLSLLGPDMPGVEIQAHVLAQLLDGRRLPRPPAWLDLAAAPLAAWRRPAGRRGRARRSRCSSAWRSSSRSRCWGSRPAVYAAGGPLAWPLPPRGWPGWRRRGGHLPPRHARAGRPARADAPLRPPPLGPDRARDLGRARDTFLAGGRPRPQTLTATVLFSDIEGFTGDRRVAGAGGADALARGLPRPHGGGRRPARRGRAAVHRRRDLRRFRRAGAAYGRGGGRRGREAARSPAPSPWRTRSSPLQRRPRRPGPAADRRPDRHPDRADRRPAASAAARTSSTR